MELPVPKTKLAPDPARLRANAEHVVGALKLLSHPDRLLLLCTLAQQEMCVGDLEEALDIRQPSLSQQLGVLRNDGAVTTRREGKNIFYSVADPALVEVLHVLYRIYCSKD